MARNIEFSQNTIEGIADLSAKFKATVAAKAEGKPYAEKGGLLDQTKEACKALNKSIIKDAIGEFVTIATTDKVQFFKEYMADWTVIGYSVKESDKDGLTMTLDKELRVLFSDIDAAMVKGSAASRGHWMKMASVLIDNCTLAWANDGGVSKNELPFDLLQFRKTLGENWMDEKGRPLFHKKALVAQFNEVIKAILPEELVFPMNNSTVTAFSKAVHGYKRTTANRAMTFKLSSGKSAEEILFDTIYTRMNKLSVVVEDDYKRDGEKKQPATMGEKPAEGSANVTIVEEEKTVQKAAPAIVA